MEKRIRPESLVVEITSILSEYSQDIADALKEEVKETAKECAENIKAKAPEKTGKYKKGWKAKPVYESSNDIRIRVYNSTRPQLAHLLEYGHAKAKGGRVEGRAHIRPAEEKAKARLEGKAKVIVKG